MNAWVIGYIAGAAVVVVVATVLVLLIAAARRVARQTEDIMAALEDARTNTLGLWRVADINDAAGRIVTAATSARENLASREGSQHRRTAP